MSIVSIGILGAGTWGTALARLLDRNGHAVTVWSALPREVEELSATRRHPNLPGMVIPERITFTGDIREACAEKDILLFAVPSVYVRSTAEKARPFVPDGQVIVDVAKGIEPDTLMTMTEVIASAIRADGQHEGIHLVALSGPTHAEEVALDMPTSIVAACTEMRVAERVQDVFMNTCMRTYTNTDVLGVELCGALKNIVALASGVSSGLGYGDNTRAALITRGMAEITRLGLAMGCAEQTFGGLAGIGDLIVTATSAHSRNNRCGQLIGQGLGPMEAVRKVGMVVEGVNALPAAMQLAERYHVEMPIVAAVDAVINGRISALDMGLALMTRDKTSEVKQADLAARLESAAQRHRMNGQVCRVMALCAFESLGYEEICYLQRAKEQGSYLVAALPKGERDEARSAMLSALRCVDQTVLLADLSALPRIVREWRIDVLVLPRGMAEQVGDSCPGVTVMEA